MPDQPEAGGTLHQATVPGMPSESEAVVRRAPEEPEPRPRMAAADGIGLNGSGARTQSERDLRRPPVMPPRRVAWPLPDLPCQVRASPSRVTRKHCACSDEVQLMQTSPS